MGRPSARSRQIASPRNCSDTMSVAAPAPTSPSRNAAVMMNSTAKSGNRTQFGSGVTTSIPRKMTMQSPTNATFDVCSRSAELVARPDSTCSTTAQATRKPESASTYGSPRFGRSGAMTSAAIAPATRVHVIARSKRRGARPISITSARRASVFDEEDPCGCTVTAFELDRTAGEVVRTGPDILQVEPLDDHDLRAEERLVGRITLLLRPLWFDGEVIDANKLHAAVDAPARCGAVERDEVAVERLHRLAPALAVTRLEQDALRSRRYARLLEPGRADIARAIELDDATRSHERVDRELIDGACTLDEVHRWIHVCPGVVAERDHRDVRGVAFGDASQRHRLRALLAGPCRHVRAHHQRDVVYLHARTSTTVFICEGS